MEQIFEAVHGPIDHHSNGGSSSSISRNQRHTGYYNFLLRSVSAAPQQEDLHPLPSQMLFLWQIYTENIDPFIKILHVPTTTKIIHELRGRYYSLDLSMQALLLVIALAAIMSLEGEEVRQLSTRCNMVIWLISLGKGPLELPN